MNRLNHHLGLARGRNRLLPSRHEGARAKATRQKKKDLYNLLFTGKEKMNKTILREMFERFKILGILDGKNDPLENAVNKLNLDSEKGLGQMKLLLNFIEEIDVVDRDGKPLSNIDIELAINKY